MNEDLVHNLVKKDDPGVTGNSRPPLQFLGISGNYKEGRVLPLTPEMIWYKNLPKR